MIETLAGITDFTDENYISFAQYDECEEYYRCTGQKTSPKSAVFVTGQDDKYVKGFRHFLSINKSPLPFRMRIDNFRDSHLSILL